MPVRFFSSLLVWALILLGACSTQPTEVSLQTAVSPVSTTTSTPIPSSTPNSTVVISAKHTARAALAATQNANYTATANARATRLALTPSPTPSPTAPTLPTLTPAVTKPVIVSHELVWGDGGWDGGMSFYFQLNLPYLILYKDGQLIVKNNDVLYEKPLSDREIKSFLNRIRRAGFFSIKPPESLIFHEEMPIYKFPPEAQFSEGASGELLFVADGNESNQINIYRPYKQYFTPQMQTLYDLFANFPLNGFRIYIPKQLVLWVEKSNGEGYYLFTPKPAIEWPNNLPALEEFGMGHIVIAEDLIPRVMAAFSYKLGGRVFIENGQTFFVVLRPLLPNESPSDPSGFYPRYFACGAEICQ